MILLKKILGSLEARLCQPFLNIWRTVYFNFRTLPFSLAIKFPIYIYGNMHFFMLNGNVDIKSDKLKRGMIKIGINGDSFSLSDGSGYIQISSKKSRIIFEGPCRIALNSKIRVVNGILKFGPYTRIGSGTKIICNGGKISVGAHTGITFACTVMNSSFHYIYDSEKCQYNNRTKNITIGQRNWIGNQTTILGGTITSDDTIVGSGSLLNSSYLKYDEKNVLLAGRPAKAVKFGLKRVFSPKIEVKVSELFKNNDIEFISSPEFIDNPEDIIIEM